MHAANAARCEHINARKVRCNHGGRNGCGPCAPRCDAGRNIGARQFGHIGGLAKVFQLVVVQTNVQRPLDHRDGRWHRAVFAHLSLDQTRGFDVLGVGHAVGDNRAFKRNQRSAVFHRVADFGRKGHWDHFGFSPET